MWRCIRVMQRKKRHRSELPRIGCKPDTADADESKEVEPVNRNVIAVKSRCDDPVRVDDTHKENEYSNTRDPSNMSLLESREKQEEGDKEMKRNQYGCYPLPSVVDAAQIPLNLFRKIARPYDQELRKRQIGPKHHKRQEQV